MTQENLTKWNDDWNEDIEASADQEYEALLRAIRWAKGFGLLFVQCSPAEGERLMQRIQQDVGGKRFDRLALDETVTDFYRLLQSQSGIDATEVLFVTGLDKSLVEYMEPRENRAYTARDFYAEDKIPKLLGQLNLQREKLKETFSLCFIFLVPRYTMTYLVRKAPDFFDWRAGMWEFVSPQEEVQQKSQQILQEGNYEQYLSWSSGQRRARIFEIDDLVSDGHLSDGEIARLRFEQGNIYVADRRYEEAVAAYDQALAIKPDKHEALNNKGYTLLKWDKLVAAKESLDKAFELKSEEPFLLESMAFYFLLSNDSDQAIAYLTKSINLDPSRKAAIVNVQDFGPLHQDPRFQALIASLEPD